MRLMDFTLNNRTLLGITLAVGIVIDDFFVQAEDGIRYLHVTGVQTCALPISLALAPSRRRPSRSHGQGAARPSVSDGLERSGGRRVGKECRSRWSPYH